MPKNLVGVQSGDWYDDNDHFKSMKMARECGFEAIDFNIDHVLDPQKFVKGEGEYPIAKLPLDEFVEYYRPLGEAAEINGITISQMHAPFPIYFEDKKEETAFCFEVVEKCLAVCQAVGCPALVVHPYVDQNGDKEKEFFVNFNQYRALMPAAKKYGVKICLENIPRWKNGYIINGCCTDVDEACYYVDALNEEAGEEIFGFCFDVGHANVTGRDIKHDLKVLADRVTVLHIHDNDRNQDLHLIPYTAVRDYKLTLDWDGFVEGLKAIGYSGTLSFETFNGVKKMPKEATGAALKLVRAIGESFVNRLDQ